MRHRKPNLFLSMLLAAPALLAFPPASQAAAVQFSFGPPPIVLGCSIQPGVDVLACLNSAVGKEVDAAVNQAVEASRAAMQNTIEQIEIQHGNVVAGLESQISQLQQQLDSAGQAAEGGARRVIDNSRRTVQQGTTAMSQALAGMNGPLNDLNGCLAGRGVDLSAVLQAGMADPAAFARGQLISRWNAIFSRADRYPRLQFDPKHPPAPAQLMQQASTLLDQLAQQDPVSSCLWSISEPVRQQALSAAQQIFPAIAAQFQQALDQIARPMAEQAIAALLQPYLQEITGLGARAAGGATHAAARAAMSRLPEEVRRQIFALAHDRIMNSAELQNLRVALDGYSIALKDPARAQRAYANLQSKINMARAFTDAEAAAIGVEVLKSLGHRLIDSPEGQALLEMAITQIMTLGDGVDGVVNSITGTASQPTTLASNVITFCVEFGLNSLITVAQYGITQATHVAWEQTAQAARQSHGARGRAPSDRVRLAMGGFGDLLNHFPSEADLIVYTSPLLEQIRQDLFNYHTAVLKLAQSALPTAPSYQTPRKTSAQPLPSAIRKTR